VVLRVRKGRVFKGQLMPKRHYWLAQFFRLLHSFFHMYLLTPVLKRAACDVCQYTFHREQVYIVPQVYFMKD
jgi:hypothetical protein